MVWQKTFQSATTQVRQELDLGGFAGGIYLLKIQTEDGYISSKILKQ
ncbi:MAG: T9SS type A sorting domain-containing protein [Saprospiraceae bacterium]|nr:T9SS type A sorting domain-containing protein [Saprospiraceae bacterium]